MAIAVTMTLPSCLIWSIILVSNLLRSGNGERGVSYDYLLLAKTWPPSLCNMAPDFPNCSATQPNYFTVHGLWPQNYTGGTRVNCEAHNDPYVYELLTYGHKHFIEELEHYWPSLSSMDNKDFWGEEWRKHGTCSNMNLLQYFHTVVDLVKTYDLRYALFSSEKKIKSGQSYNKEDILNAISAKTKRLAGLSCSDGNKHLYEIFVCISKIGFSAQDCPPDIVRSPSCPDLVYFPP